MHKFWICKKVISAGEREQEKQGWIVMFGVMIRVSLIEKGKCEQRIEEG